MTTQTQDVRPDVSDAAAALVSDVNTQSPNADDKTGDAPTYDPAVVEYAKRQGWKDKSEYAGEPDEWVPPDVFADRAKQINPILRSRNKALETALQKQSEEIADLRSGMEEFKKFTQDRAKEAFNVQIARLRNERAEAISNSDGMKVNEIDEKIDRLRDEQTANAAPARAAERKAPEVPPEVREGAQAFAVRYAWYGTDRRKTAVANAIAEEVAEEMPHLKNTPQFFSELDRRVKLEFGGGDSRGSLVEAGGNGASRTPRKSFNSIPASDREQADRLIRQGLFKDRQEYADAYFEDNPS